MERNQVMACHCKHALVSALAWNILLVFTSQLLLSCGAVAWNAATFVSECGGGLPSSLLCDPSSLLHSQVDVESQLAEVNNNTEGVINWEHELYYGYVIAAAVIDNVEPHNETDTTESVSEFGRAVQQSWFGGRICDNSTLVLLSLNTSQFFLFPGEGTDLRLRSHHKEACSHLRPQPTNATAMLMACIEAVDEALEDALKPWSNAVWGYTGIVVIMTMLIFHYWIK